MTPRQESAEVVVIGAGPAGLAAAESLARAGLRDVVVLDRDEQPGGVPRHADHPGYGVRDLHRSMTGPAYARVRADRAVTAGADLRLRATVTGWTPDRRVEVTSPAGRTVIEAGAVVVATGCRERPRSARLVPGDRPAGVLTTGWLQRLVHLDHRPVGTAAVVVGAEHVSYSAVMTLAEAGCRTVAMVTDLPRPTTHTAFQLAARTRWALPVLTGCRVTAVLGRGRVSGVEVARLSDGRRTLVPCDTVVFTGDWVAEYELPRRAGVLIDPGTGGPAVDAALRTSAPGVFAAGNLLHPAATADVCALDGAHLAAGVVDWLRGARWPASGVAVEVAAPLLWAAPNRIGAGPGAARPARGRLLLQTASARRLPTVVVTQDGATQGGSAQGEVILWRGRIPQAVPTRPFSIPAGWLAAVDPTAGPVRVSLR